MSLPPEYITIPLQICGNCLEMSVTHVAGKCLFHPTTFRPATPEEELLFKQRFLVSSGGAPPPWKYRRHL